MEFLRIQIPTDITNGTRTRATQMLTSNFVEICSTSLSTALRRLRFVEMSSRPTFYSLYITPLINSTNYITPLINSTNYILHAKYHPVYYFVILQVTTFRCFFRVPFYLPAFPVVIISLRALLISKSVHPQNKLVNKHLQKKHIYY